MVLFAMLACQPRPTAELALRIETGEGLRDLRVEAAAGSRFTWTEDGLTTAWTEAVVPARALWPGARWRVDVESPDGRRGSAEYVVPEPIATNVLVLLLDDVGIDKLAAYDGPYAGSTPTLDRLASEGVRFSRAYASAVCSPTRGSLLTGRHPRRTGLGWIVDTGSRDGMLPLEATTIPEALRDGRGQAWSNAALGKWHLAGPEAVGVHDHPNDQGFTHYAGTLGNPEYRPGRGYYHWTKTVDGIDEPSEVYLTTDTVDDALEQVNTLPEPWFVYVAFNAPHGPVHWPPKHLVPDLDITQPERPAQYNAMLTALDTEIGRLLAQMDPGVLARTSLFTLGDNGTSPAGVPLDSYEERFKHTPYEGGVRVPFLVNGPLVEQPGTVNEALVHVVDLLPTVADLAGIPLEGPEGETLVLEDQQVGLDGRSLLPVLAGRGTRAHLYSETFRPNGPVDAVSGERALRSLTHKMIRYGDGTQQFFRLEGPQELDLVDREFLARSPQDEAAHLELSEAFQRLEQSLVYEGR